MVLIDALKDEDNEIEIASITLVQSVWIKLLEIYLFFSLIISTLDPKWKKQIEVSLSFFHIWKFCAEVLCSM